MGRRLPAFGENFFAFRRIICSGSKFIDGGRCERLRTPFNRLPDHSVISSTCRRCVPERIPSADVVWESQPRCVRRCVRAECRRRVNLRLRTRRRCALESDACASGDAERDGGGCVSVSNVSLWMRASKAEPMPNFAYKNPTNSPFRHHSHPKPVALNTQCSAAQRRT